MRSSLSCVFYSLLVLACVLAWIPYQNQQKLLNQQNHQKQKLHPKQSNQQIHQNHQKQQLRPEQQNQQIHQNQKNQLINQNPQTHQELQNQYIHQNQENQLTQQNQRTQQYQQINWSKKTQPSSTDSTQQYNQIHQKQQNIQNQTIQQNHPKQKNQQKHQIQQNQTNQQKRQKQQIQQHQQKHQKQKNQQSQQNKQNQETQQNNQDKPFQTNQQMEQNQPKSQEQQLYQNQQVQLDTKNQTNQQNKQNQPIQTNQLIQQNQPKNQKQQLYQNQLNTRNQSNQQNQQSEQNPQKPEKMQQKDPWIVRDPLTPLDHLTLIIAPYYDPRVGPAVRVLAIIHVSVKELYCLFHCSANQTTSVQARIDIHRDRFGFPYGTADLLCVEPPRCNYHYMSFRSNISESRMFRVQNLPPPPISSNFTVCISTLYGGFSNVLQTVQSIEMYKILGASRVTIYNTSCSRDVDKVLWHYIEEGTLEVVPWPIDLHLRTSHQWHYSEGLTSQVGYYGQTAALNDCLYRNMFRSRYVLLNDIDEIILPVRDWDWPSLMERLQKEHPGASVFRFESHVFATPANIPEFRRWSHVPGINILLYHHKQPINRTDHNPRKMIVDPSKVFQTSIHYAAKYSGKARDVPANASFIFHCNSKKNQVQASTKLIQDNLLQRYNGTLVRRVDAVIQRLFPPP